MENVSTNFSNLKSKVDELNVDILVSVSVDLRKLSDVVKMMLLKKMYIMLRSKILKIKYLILLTYQLILFLINKIKNEITSINNLATNASLNAKINEVNREIPSITNLATTAILISVENKIPKVSDLVRKKSIL